MSPSGRPRNESAPARTAAAAPSERGSAAEEEEEEERPPRLPPAPAVLDIPPQPSYTEAANSMSVPGNALINIIPDAAAD